MKKKLLLVVSCLTLLIVSLSFAQQFPPTLEGNKGPFPTGKEKVRDDASVDLVKPSPSGVIHEYTAYKGKPVVDGELDDEIWQKIPWTPLEYYIDQVTRTEEFDLYQADAAPTYWDGWGDCCAWFKIVWDDSNIYLATKRVDDDYSFVAGTDVSTGNIWQNDGWQIKLDTRPTGEFTAVAPGSEFGFCIVDEENEVYNYWSNSYNSNKKLELAEGGNTSSSASADAKAIFAKKVDTADGYEETFEIAFTIWDEIVENEVQMFSICALDRDADKQQCVLQWAQGIYVKNIEHYGSLLWSSNPPVTGIENNRTQLLTQFTLEQNYPNPFNPVTNIVYNISRPEYVKLEVFDVLGKSIAQLVNKNQDAGSYNVTVDMTNQANGTYFYKLTAGSHSATKKMLLLK